MTEHVSFQNPTIPDGEPINGRAYRADGWQYFDPPGKYSPEAWNKMIDLLGEENVHALVMSRGRDRGGDWIRGQLLISPTGLARVTAALAKERTNV